MNKMDKDVPPSLVNIRLKPSQNFSFTLCKLSCKYSAVLQFDLHMGNFFAAKL